jgi:hypothetical protein
MVLSGLSGAARGVIAGAMSMAEPDDASMSGGRHRD